MSVDKLVDNWKECRVGLLQEAEQIPADQFSFRATRETRSVAELLRHVVETQKVLVGEVCRAETNLMRQSFADHIKEYASEAASATDKDTLLELLRTSMDHAEASLRSNAGKLNESMRRFDGKEMSKLDMLNFIVSHEMYHRGQVTVYERLLNIEPALTQRFKKLFARAG